MACPNSAGRWQAQVRCNNLLMGLGTFDTKERAQVAERLFRLWRRRGLMMPNRPKTVDAV